MEMKDVFDNKFTDQVSLTYDHLVPEISSYLKINEKENELLEELDIIEHSHQAHSSGLYYLKGKQTNTHIACEGCGNIEDISDKTMIKVNELIAKDSGYKIEKNHFVYSGICKKCK